MDPIVKQLEKRPTRNEPKNYVQSLTSLQIGALTEDILTQSNSTASEQVLALRDILLGDPNSARKRLVVIRAIIEWLGKQTQATNGVGSKVKLAIMVIELVLPEFELMTPKMLEETASQIVDLISNTIPIQPRTFDLLSKLYNLLCALGEIVKTKTILNSICDANWNQHSTLGIILCINEMELLSSQLNQVILRIQVQLKELDIEEVPPCIYQLLLLSRKGSKRTIISTIFNYFDWLHSSYPDISTSRIEGTTMLHITFAITQDQELGTELIKYVFKDKGLLLTRFKMASLLSVARIHRLECSILNSLCHYILSAFEDSEKLEQCSWISEYTEIDIHLIRQYIMDIVDRSSSGWDQVIQSLVKLAIVLIDDSTRLPPPNTPGTGALSLNKGISLGIDLLVKMFKLHDGVRSEILEQIKSRMVSMSNGTCAFLILLEKLILDCPYEVEQYKNIIEDGLNFLSYLSCSTAKKLFVAIRPLSSTNVSFQNGLILALRKTLFSKDLDSRMIATNGLLALLHNHLTRTQACTSTAEEGSTSGTAFEILGLLRRCFSQQHQVRSCVYVGLGSLMDYYGDMIEDLFKFLYAQYMKCFGVDNSMDALLPLSSFVEDGLKPNIIEPVNVLLSNLLKVVRHMKAGKYHFTITKQLQICQDQIDSLVFKLTELDLGDYGLGKTTNFDTTTSNGLYFYHIADIMLGCFDVGMEHEIMDQGNTLKSCQVLLDLFKQRQSLLDLLMDNVTKDKGHRLCGTRNSTQFGLQSIVKISYVLLAPTDTQSPHKILRANMDLMHHVVSVTPTILAEVYVDDVWQDEKNLSNCVDLAELYMYVLTHENPDSKLMMHRMKKGKSLLEVMTLSLKCTMETVCTLWPDKYIALLLRLESVISDTYSSQNTDQSVDDLIDTFRKILDKYMNAKLPLYKESVNIMQIIYYYTNRLDAKKDNYTQHLNKIIEWLQQTAQKRSIIDISTAKEIGVMNIQLCAQVNKLDIIKDIAQDLHHFFGGIGLDNADEMDQDLNSGLVNRQTSNTMVILVFSFIKKANRDMIWVIGRLKLSALSSDDAKATQHLDFEQMVWDQVTSYVDIICECLDTKLKDPHATRWIKILKRTYRTFSAIVKYKLETVKTGVSQAFIDFVTRIGGRVTNRIYNFLDMYGDLRKFDYEKATRAKPNQKTQVNAKEKIKILRETKAIPDLIFAVEQFEQYVLKLTRKSKVDLMQYMKPSKSRDFEIKMTSMDLCYAPGSTSRDNSEDDELSDSGTDEDGSA